MFITSECNCILKYAKGRTGQFFFRGEFYSLKLLRIFPFRSPETMKLNVLHCFCSSIIRKCHSLFWIFKATYVKSHMNSYACIMCSILIVLDLDSWLSLNVICVSLLPFLVTCNVYEPKCTFGHTSSNLYYIKGGGCHSIRNVCKFPMEDTCES